MKEKKIIYSIVFFILTFFIVNGFNVKEESSLAMSTTIEDGETLDTNLNAKNDFRAVWVTSVLNLDFPSKQGLSNGQ